MAGTNTPTPGHRFPLAQSDSGSGEQSSGMDSTSTGALVVDRPSGSSGKFGFAWPAESVPATATSVVPPTFQPSADHGVVLSSSESGYSDPESAAEDRSPEPMGINGNGNGNNGTNSLVAEPEDFSDFTPTSESTAMEKGMPTMPPLTPPPVIPRLTRAFSVPLQSQLGYLRNPRRPSQILLPDAPTSPLADEPISPTPANVHDLSLELADSVQMMVQTLLQLSPPQLFDPAKEQYAACSLSIPTPSMSAMLTSMKNLNYMSANMSTFSTPSMSRTSSSVSLSASEGAKSQTLPNNLDNFDVGEMLQSVGDAISGVAAQADVEIVLYHGDVGMKHVYVKGDECGISYTLLHVRSINPFPL